MIWPWCKVVLFEGKKKVSSRQILLITEHSSDLDTQWGKIYLVGKWAQTAWNFLSNKYLRYYWTCKILNSSFKFKYLRKEKQMCMMGTVVHVKFILLNILKGFYSR